jgi:hypothetical protein
MAYEAVNKAGGPESREQNNAAPGPAFQDHALLIFYVVAIAISMGGWLWFLAYLSWGLLGWAALH